MVRVYEPLYWTDLHSAFGGSQDRALIENLAIR